MTFLNVKQQAKAALTFFEPCLEGAADIERSDSGLVERDCAIVVANECALNEQLTPEDEAVSVNASFNSVSRGSTPSRTESGRGVGLRSNRPRKHKLIYH